MKTKLNPLKARILAAASRSGLRRQRKHRAAARLPVGALYLCLGWAANAAPGSWTHETNTPAPQTTSCASCVLDGILYVIGGHYPDPNTALQTVWAYNPQADSWTTKADLPTPRHWLGQCAVAVDGIMYVVGGSGSGTPGTPVRPVAAYNPGTDTWTNGANIPTGRGALAACAVDGIIYAIGGINESYQELAAVEAYDPKSNQWTRKSSMPQTCSFLTASVVNGLIYVFEGTNTFAYDPKTDHWTTKTNHFSPYRWALMSAEVNGLIYLFGGFTEDGTSAYNFTLAYDPAQDQFTARRTMPRQRSSGACGAIGGKVYLAAGVDKPSTEPDPVYYAALDVFDPQGGVTPQILSLSCENPNCAWLRWQGEPGIWYGVESRPNVTSGDWTRMMFTTGTNTVLATNVLVEAACIVPAGDTNRFFRVLEAD